MTQHFGKYTLSGFAKSALLGVGIFSLLLIGGPSYAQSGGGPGVLPSSSGTCRPDPRAGLTVQLRRHLKP